MLTDLSSIPMEPIFSERHREYSHTSLAFFDLDMTLSNTVSGKALAHAAFSKGLLKGKDLLSAISNSLAFRWGLKDEMKIIDEMIGWVRGIPESDLRNLCSEVFNKVILPSIFNEARKEIELQKSKPAKVVILSSSLAPLCSMVADHLKMDDFLCTKLEISDGLYTGRPEGIPCFGRGKVIALKEYCERNNSIPEDAWYYGDSTSDIPVLSAVGHPVCINPSRNLRKKAAGENWPVLCWR